MTIKTAALVYLATLPIVLVVLAAIIAAVVRAFDAGPTVVRRTSHRVRETARAVAAAHETMRLPSRGQPRTAPDMAPCLAHASGLPLPLAWVLCLPSDARVVDAWRTARVTIDVEARILALALAARVRRWRAGRDRRRPTTGRRVYLGSALDGPQSF